MTEEKKPKRKYTRRPKIEPLAVSAMMVKVTRGRKMETIYVESTRVENGCLVIVSMDGPPPLVKKTRYIPFGSAEIEVYQRMPQTPAHMYFQEAINAPINSAPQQFSVLSSTAGPRIEPGPLEIARRQRIDEQIEMAARGAVLRTRETPPLVERNADGVAVVTAGFGDERPV